MLPTHIIDVREETEKLREESLRTPRIARNPPPCFMGRVAGAQRSVPRRGLQVRWYGPWPLADLVILVNAPSFLLASEMPDSRASIIVGIGPIVCYPAYVIAVVSFRKWFIRGFVLVCILGLHLWAFRQVMEKIMSALGTILSSQ